MPERPKWDRDGELFESDVAHNPLEPEPIDVPVIDRRTGEPLPMPDPEPEPVEGEVVTEPVRAVVPYAPSAGEVVDLADRPRVAATIRELEDWQAEVLKPLVAALKAALIEEADVQAAYTLRYGRFTISVDGPDVAKYEWQPDLLPMLTELILAGMPEDRARMLAAETTVWKPNHTEVNRACKVEKYRSVIERYRVKVPKNRSVNVKRSG